MSNTSASAIRTIDVAMLAAGEVHILRIEDKGGVADLCALLQHLRERGLTVTLEGGREPPPAGVN